MNPRIAYFGTPEWARYILEKLIQSGYTPELVISNPDRPQGRGLELQAPPVKTLALQKGIEVLQPEKIDECIKERLESTEWDLFIVVAYGKILPQWLLDIPKNGTLNIHFSLLPYFRGATPVETQVLEGAETTGVTIMFLDEKVDHGPILSRAAFPMPEPLPTSGELGTFLTEKGAELLIETLPLWLEGAITPEEQDHDKATFTRKFSKGEGELDLSKDDLQNWRKIQAFSPSPGTYFFHEGKRVKVNKARFENGILTLENVTPEGKNPMSYMEFKTRFA